MSKKLLILYFVALQILQVGVCFARDIVSVQQKNNSDSLRFNSFIERNPAAMSYRSMGDLTELEFSFNTEDQDLGIKELGTAGESFDIDVQSFQTLKNGAVSWGSMQYSNQTRDGVLLNETADYDMVYPYLMADTLGGDNLKSELYGFELGYSQSVKRFTLAGSFNYRAQKQYRSVDPRPNNTVSDLELDAGALYGLSKDYQIGLGVNFISYKQSSTLTFNSEISAPQIIQVQGLGSINSLFTSQFSSYLYKGKSYGLNATLLNTARKGFNAVFAYNKYKLEKQLPEQLYLTMSEIDESVLDATLSYKFSEKANSPMLRLGAKSAKRIGTEHRFVKAESNIFERISTAEKYSHEYQSVDLAAYLILGLSAKSSLSFEPSLTYFNSAELYESPNRELSYSNVSEGLALKYKRRFKESVLSISPSIILSQNIDKELNLSGLSSDLTTYQVLENNYNYYTQDFISYSILLDYVFKIDERFSARTAFEGYLSNIDNISPATSLQNKGWRLSASLLF